MIWMKKLNTHQTITYKLETPFYKRHHPGFDGVDKTCFSSACAMLLKTLRERSFDDYEDYLESVSDIR